MSFPGFCQDNEASCASLFSNFPFASFASGFSFGPPTATQTVTVNSGNASISTSTFSPSGSGASGSHSNPAAITNGDSNANSSSSSTQNKSGNNTAAIVGGTLGGVAFILFALAILYAICRRRNRQQLYESGEKGSHPQAPLPDQETHISSGSIGGEASNTRYTAATPPIVINVNGNRMDRMNSHHSGNVAVGGVGGGAGYFSEKASRQRNPQGRNRDAYRSVTDTQSQSSIGPLITPIPETGFNYDMNSSPNRADSTGGTSDNPSLSDSLSLNFRNGVQPISVPNINTNVNPISAYADAPGAGVGMGVNARAGVSERERRSISARTLAEQMAPTLSPTDLDRLADTIVARMQRPTVIALPGPPPIAGSEIDVATDLEYQEPPPPWRASWVGPPGTGNDTGIDSGTRDGSGSSAQQFIAGITSSSNQSGSTRHISTNNSEMRYPDYPNSSLSTTSTSSIKKSAILSTDSQSLPTALVTESLEDEARGTEKGVGTKGAKDGEQLRVVNGDSNESHEHEASRSFPEKDIEGDSPGETTASER